MNLDDIAFKDFQNPWTFHNLFNSDDDEVFQWLRTNGLLAKEVMCRNCNTMASLKRRSRIPDGYSFRCPGSKHEFSMRKNSFFEGSAYNIRDLIIFLKYYLEGHTLHQCALSTNMDYKHTAVDWGSYVRELFCQFVADKYPMTTFDGDVEIDESLFGRKIKYNKGEPKGHRIWIFGKIERSSNALILYPFDKRDADTLISLIQRHVYPGSRIFSDSWGAYLNLNDLGYQHYTVVHKSNFKQTYQNASTCEIVECHTNRIEGAWKHCKDHFRRINGTNTKLFEQHLAEIVWRNHVSDKNRYEAFFELVKTVYPLDRKRRLDYPNPLFQTWTPPQEKHGRRYSIVQESDSDSATESDSAAPKDDVFDVDNGSSNDRNNNATRDAEAPARPISTAPSSSRNKEPSPSASTDILTSRRSRYSRRNPLPSTQATDINTIPSTATNREE